MEARTAPQSVTLVRHPDSEASAITQVTVTVARYADTISFRFVARGDVSGVAVPSAKAFERCDELWKHTCFEAFIESVDDGSGYLEFNFSPSGQWAAYRFDGYREGMRDLDDDPVRKMEFEATDGSLVLEAVVREPGKGVLILGLSLIEEDREGRKAFWALAHHEDGPPDFHNPIAFDFPLFAMERP